MKTQEISIFFKKIRLVPWLCGDGQGRGAGRGADRGGAGGPAARDGRRNRRGDTIGARSGCGLKQTVCVCAPAAAAASPAPPAAVGSPLGGRVCVRVSVCVCVWS